MSTTRRALWALLVSLVLTATTACGSAWWLYDRLSSTTETVRDRTGPAVQDLAAARSALAEAHQEALTAFASGQAGLVGPGERYQDRIAAVSQSLTRVASATATGDRLQVAEGLLVAYIGAVEQADANHRVAGEPTRAVVADLVYAARLAAQVLDELGGVLDEQRLDDSAGVRVGLWWWLGTVPLLLALVGTQVWLGTRFRRTLDPGLLAATAVAVAFAVLGAGWATGAGTALTEGTGTLRGTAVAWEQRTRTHVAEGARTLKSLLPADCPRCAVAVADLTAEPAAPTDPTSESAITGDGREAAERFDRAADTGRLAWAAGGAFVLLVGLSTAALSRYLLEYRFRPRGDAR
ncbi:integral membrane protein [Actinokineospora spheciospongiae]|uniref:Integral membrane protein n=1 Tax=Actinokineospora spheciospongiae TaxID=909613 RepID=W7INK3_9PSEU|nr:hypothetical protein [Actinokineospora spheciospongiae]EWC58091.1 integral membrane protein [Actinokineospora spheciospongiae]PWW66721.1 hypothetical protein DFQ13_101237 [Actinokineospora spheciospongiae]